MSESRSPRNWLQGHLHVPRGLLLQTGWTTIGYGATQAMRLLSTIVLTRLLAPELFGVMVLLTSLRVGIELFTDLGIGQSVIASRRTREEIFYNTAWTMQLLRGLLLGGLVLLILPLLRSFYDDAMLRDVLPVLSLMLILTSWHSIAPTIATKELRTKRIAAYEIICAIAQTALIVGSVLVSPTIIGLIVGQVLSSLFAAAASYFILTDLRLRLVLDRTAFWELISFGKWIFLSSIVFFLSSYLDRLLLGKYATLAMLGIYGIARSLGDIVAQFGTRMGNAIIFPKVASAEVRGTGLRDRVRKRRLQFLSLIMMAVAGLMAFSQPIIAILYDPRYLGAAQVLPWIALATWLAVINTVSDSLALGVGKPRVSMIGNVVKLVALGALLPYGITKAGIAGAAMAGVAAEITRYAALKWGLLADRLSFIRQDVVTTALLLGTAFLAHELMQRAAPEWFSFALFGGWPR